MTIPAWPCGQPKPQPNHGADHSPRAVSAGSEITAQITHPITAQITAPTRRLAPRRSFEFGCDLGCDLAVICLWFGCEMGGSLPSPAGGPNHSADHSPRAVSAQSEITAQTKSQPKHSRFACDLAAKWGSHRKSTE